MGGTSGTYKEYIHVDRDVCKILVGKSEGKRPLGRLRRRWENIKLGHQAVECGGMDWIDLDQNKDIWQALVDAVMNLRFP
jgi:hypothetical protein